MRACLVILTLITASWAGPGLVAATLVLRTEPGGARVRLDTVERGHTDLQGMLSIPDLAPGPHLLQLDLDGYTPVATVVAVGEGLVAQTVRLIPVEPEAARGGDQAGEDPGDDEDGEDDGDDPGDGAGRGTLKVDARAAGIAIQVDGAPAGVTDRTGLLLLEGLAPGPRNVLAAFKGTVFGGATVEVRSDEVALVTLKPPEGATMPSGLPLAVNAAVVVLGLFILGSLVFLGVRWRRLRRAPAVEKREPRAEADVPMAVLAMPFAFGGLKELEGRPLNARFRAERLLEASESMGVFQGSLQQTRLAVRVEVFLPALSDRPDVAAMLLEDLRLAANISHPQHLSVLDFGKTRDGVLFAVTEDASPVTLETALREAGGPMRPARVLSILTQVASVLEAAHAHGIIHRDLRPARVMLAPRADGAEDVKVGGFGVARAWQTREGVLAEDAAMLSAQSPEQLARVPIDARSDVFSLGVLAYRMLFGEAPFQARDRESLLAAYRDAQLPLLRDSRLPPAARSALLYALWTDPARRTPSPGALAAALVEAFGL
jgi:hypothetical protein